MGGVMVSRQPIPKPLERVQATVYKLYSMGVYNPALKGVAPSLVDLMDINTVCARWAFEDTRARLKAARKPMRRPGLKSVKQRILWP